jgi:predicted RNase H-like nuclease (RuvC/YqgF family)
MGRITFTADDQHERIIDDAQDQHDLDSTAAAVRHCIEGYADLQQQVSELNDEIDTLNDDIDGLKAELDDERQERRMVLSLAMGNDVDPQQLENAEYVDVGTDDDPDTSPPADAGLSGRIRWLLFGTHNDD